jgi:hypothetical protein
MPTFIDSKQLVFDGALIILNIGADNYAAIGMDHRYNESLENAIRTAHAKGHVVVYLFDNLHGVSPKPDDLPSLEGHDISRLMASFSRHTIADFSYDPETRMTAFREISDGVKRAIRIDTTQDGSCSIMGLCKIQGEQVLLPLTEIL